MSSFRTFIVTFIASLLIFGVFAAVISGLLSDTLNSLINGSVDDIGGENTDIDNGNLSDDVGGSTFNILLIGTDYQPELLSDYDPAKQQLYPSLTQYEIDYDRGLSPYNYRKISADTIVLVRVNKEDALVSYTYLPSNMQVTVGGVDSVLGEAWHDHGIDYLKEMVKSLTGWNIDYYVIADVNAFAEALDLIDGIRFNVPCDMEYSDPAQNLYISLKAGNQKLNGKEVVNLLRFNNYTDPEMSRGKTTVAVAKAIAEKATNIIYLNRALSMYETVLEGISTDFTYEVLKDNLALIFSYGDFDIYELAYPGSYTEFEGETYFIPSISQALKTFASNK
jgi:LCP family protein required for cell wall assembly